MQIMRFSNGGYVIHKITGSFRGRISAWYDANDNLLDAERIDRDERSQPVKRNGPIWDYLGTYGARINRHYEAAVKG